MQVKNDGQGGFLKKVKKKENEPFQKLIINDSKKKKKGKQKGRENSMKQNHVSRSKNKQSKVSPLHLNKKKLNNSPLNKKSRSKSRQLSYRKSNTYRDNEKKSQLISTKMVTERSPHIEKQGKNSPISRLQKRKSKKDKKKIEKNKKDKEKKISSPPSTSRIKLKKQIPNIKTSFSNRKQSYFDENLLRQLNIKHAESIKKQEEYSYEFGLKSARKQIQDQKYKEKSYQDFGTNTNFEPVFNRRDLEHFRKEQQLKWKIICLELEKLKKNRNEEGLEEMICESDRFLSELIEDSKKIITHKSLDQYILESPGRVKKALRNKKKSLEEKREIIKNHSQQKLLLQLQNMENLNQLSLIRDQSSKQSFCVQFQKQLESYQANNDTPSAIFNQIQFLPEIQIDKANFVCEAIQDLMIVQFCKEMVSNESILHQYLVCMKEDAEKCQKINSSNTFTIKIVEKLFQFLIEKKVVKQILKRLNISFGHHPIVNLKWVRNYFRQDSESVEEIQQTPEPILDSILLNDFDSTNYIIPVESQYFYNHCVYGCVNQLLDGLRPFGIQGKPPLFIGDCSRNFKVQQIKETILMQFQKIISVRMGRAQFQQQEENPVVQMEKTFKKMDVFMVLEEQLRWQNNEDIIFQIKYILASTIFDQILDEECLMIFNK